MKTDHITNDPNFKKWIIELDLAARKRNLIIPVIHHDAILGIWCLSNGDAIEKDVDHYEDFLRRWGALNSPGGDFYKEPDPILCGECWLNSGPDNSPVCKCNQSNK